MKLVTFTQGGRTRIGAVEADEVVDFSASGGRLPQDMLSFLEHGPAALDNARTACAAGRGRVALADVTLEAPILRPPKILAVGLNYRDDIEETGRPMPEVPMIFNKQSTARIGIPKPLFSPRAAASPVASARLPRPRAMTPCWAPRRRGAARPHPVQRGGRYPARETPASAPAAGRTTVS